MKRLGLAFTILAGIVRLAVAAPEAISNLTALAGAEGVVTLQWTVPAGGVSGYIVRYSATEIPYTNNLSLVAGATTYAQNWASTASSGTLTGLTPGATLYFAIAAQNSDVWVSSDAALGINTQSYAVVYDAVPGPVTGVVAVAGNQSINLSWTPPAIDVKLYYIDRSAVSDSTLAYYATVTSPNTSYHDSPLVNGNTYYYRVRALDNTDNLGSTSLVVSTMPTIGIGAVSWGAATAPVDSARINWVWSGGAGSLGYRVISSSSGDNLSGDILDPLATNFIETGLTPNTSYQVFVRAFNGLLYTDSPTKIVYTQAHAPNGLYSPLQPGTTIINLQWPANNNPSPQTTYSVERSSTNGATWFRISSLQTATTCQDTGLKEKTTYYYRAWAVNAVSSTTAMVIISTMTGSIAPQAPDLLSAKQISPADLDGDVVLEVQAPYDDDANEYVAGYVVKYATWAFTAGEFYNVGVSTFVQNESPVKPGDPQSITVHGLYPGSTYYFAMKSFDEAGNYSAMSVVRSTTSRDNPPPTPLNVVATPYNEKAIQLSWNNPAMNGYNDLNKYVIYRATFNFTLTSQATYFIAIDTTPAPHPMFVDTSLNRKSTYYYMMSSRDLGNGPAGSGLFSAVLESTPSAVVFAYTPDQMPPCAVSDLTATPSPGISDEGKITLSWTVPTDDDDTPGINFTGRYRVDWSADSGWVTFSSGSFLPGTVTAGATDYLQLSNLAAGGTYYFRMWSQDAAGNWSTISNSTSTYAQVDRMPPGPATGLTTTVKWRQAKLSWTAPGDDGYANNLDAGSKFDIFYSPDPAFAVAVSTHIIISTSTPCGSVQQYLITGLNDGTTYYFTVRTQDDWGNWSTWVSTAQALPLDTLPTISALLSPSDRYIWTSPDHQPQLQWQDASDADAVLGDTVTYTIYYSTDVTFALTATGSSNIPFYEMQQAATEDKTYYWKVRATDLDGNTGVFTSTFSVRINRVNSAPQAFSLNLPSAGYVVATSTPTLSWYASIDSDPGDTVSYRVDYGLDPFFNAYTSTAGISGLSVITDSLVENATYWWRVWATDGSTSTLCSPTSSYFKVNAYDEAPRVFNLISPPDSTRLLTLNVTFFWEPAAEPDPDVSVKYNLCYSQYANFSTSITIAGLTQLTTTAVLPFDNQKYYWTVTAVRNGTAALSTRSTQLNMFYTDMVKELPLPFQLTDPPYGVKISTTLQPVFQWTNAIDPDPNDTVRYYIELSLTPDFSGSQPIPTGTDTFYQPLNGLLDQSTYYWRVRASGYQGVPPTQVDPGFVFSSTWVFTLAMVNSPPQPFALTSPANNAVVDVKEPVLTWAKAVDNDLNDFAVYDLMVSTVANFSALTVYAAGITDTHYTIPFPLLENRKYYWLVRARDTKGLTRTCTDTGMCFNMPIINTPALPSGIRGAISQDQNTFTLNWVAVTLNKDGSDIDDLAGYNVYRDVSVQVVGPPNPPFAFVAKGTTQLVDNTLRGGLCYYLVRAVDTSGVESENSLIIQSLNPNSLTLSTTDHKVLTALPAGISNALLPENNKWRDNLTLNLELQPNEAGHGRTLLSYKLAVRNSTLQEVPEYDFTEPVNLQFAYSSISPAPAQGKGVLARAQGAFDKGELTVYWNNGVEFIRIGGYMAVDKQQLTVQITKSGYYQLRQVERPSQFGIASINPPKVFTPGIAPYEKITFYVDNPSGDKVVGNVYDLKGEFVARLEPVGDATNTSAVLEWDGIGKPKGVYIYQLEADGKVINGTIMIAR